MSEPREPVDRVFSAARKCSAQISELLGSVEGLRAEAGALRTRLAELHEAGQGDSGGIPAK